MDTVLREKTQDVLQRLTPDAHYWLREYDPQADRELTTPLLREPSRYGMTALEKAAARALETLATWTIEYRKIHTEVFPAQDSDAPRIMAARLSEEQEGKLYGLREVFRSKALYFAQEINSATLIAAYSTPTPAPHAANSDTPEKAAPPAMMAMPADWIESARTEALKYIARHQAQNLFPSQRDVCEHVEEKLREAKTFGPQGKPLSAKYIQRNAIQGDWWKANKP